MHKEYYAMLRNKNRNGTRVTFIVELLDCTATRYLTTLRCVKFRCDVPCEYLLPLSTYGI